MILNPTKGKQRSTIPAVKREIYEFHIHGERIRFDADSLAVELVTGCTTETQRAQRTATAKEGNGNGICMDGQDRNGNGKRSAGVPPAVKNAGETPALQLPDGAIYWPRPARPNFKLGAKPGMVKKLVLNVTHDCNLACRYCFAAGHPRAQAMTADTARKAIAFAFGNAGASPAGPKTPSPSNKIDVAAGRRHDSRLGAGDTISVSFFGGEPLMNWPVVLEAIRFAELMAANRGAKAKFHITTNASLLTAEMLGELKHRDCSFLVSIDGPAEIHDHWRPMRESADYADSTDYEKQGNGKRQIEADCTDNGDGRRDARATNGSHAEAVAALELLKVHGMSHRVSVRATYPIAEPLIVERLEYLAGLERQGLIKGFSLEPAFNSEGCAVDPDADEHGETVDHSIPYHAAAVWYVNGNPQISQIPQINNEKSGVRQNGNGKFKQISAEGNGLPNYFYFRKIINRLRERKLTCSECGAGCGYMTVGPDGTIYACHRETGTEIGHVAYGIDESKRAIWLDNRYYVRDGCQKCWARNVCGGGCRQQSASNGMSLRETWRPRCRLMRAIIKECLWIMARTGGNPQITQIRNGERLRPEDRGQRPTAKTVNGNEEIQADFTGNSNGISNMDGQDEQDSNDDGKRQIEADFTDNGDRQPQGVAPTNHQSPITNHQSQTGGLIDK